MKLPQRTIVLLAGLIAIALVGLVALQYILIANAIELKQQAFTQNVNAAMNSIVQSLEAGEAVGNAIRVAVRDPQVKPRMQMFRFNTDSMISLSVTTDGSDLHERAFTSHDITEMKRRLPDQPPIRWQGQKLWFTVQSPQHVLVRAFDQASDKDTTILNEFLTAGEHSIDVGKSPFWNGEFVFKFVSDSTTAAIQMHNGSLHQMSPDNTSLRRREELVGQVIDRMFVAEQVPIEQRLNRALLDSVIERSLRSSGIELPFAYGIISERSDSLQIVQPASYAPELEATPFKARLFPNDIISSFNRLALYFPDQQIFILKQIGPLLGLTIVFMGIIVFCFAYTIRTIVRQKQFSVRLMDFMNNMTHEFKTPISTVSVAAETMMHPGVIHDEEKLRRYGTVIQDENLRMKQQVDKILQMAVLEEGTHKLKYAEVDIHEIIAKAVQNTLLQVETRGGTISSSLEAAPSTISIDTVHFSNSINSLLDNAVKYSHDPPQIRVSTRCDGEMLVIEISDTGIGISAKDLDRVFEKYYRVHTGNVHNVKGFGLGLRYVKLMTEAQGGTISLTSSLGKGTTVRLMFPILHRA